MGTRNFGCQVGCQWSAHTRINHAFIPIMWLYEAILCAIGFGELGLNYEILRWLLRCPWRPDASGESGRHANIVPGVPTRTTGSAVKLAVKLFALKGRVDRPP